MRVLIILLLRAFWWLKKRGLHKSTSWGRRKPVLLISAVHAKRRHSQLIQNSTFFEISDVSRQCRINSKRYVNMLLFQFVIFVLYSILINNLVPAPCWFQFAKIQFYFQLSTKKWFRGHSTHSIVRLTTVLRWLSGVASQSNGCRFPFDSFDYWALKRFLLQQKLHKNGSDMHSTHSIGISQMIIRI